MELVRYELGSCVRYGRHAGADRPGPRPGSLVRRKLGIPGGNIGTERHQPSGPLRIHSGMLHRFRSMHPVSPTYSGRTIGKHHFPQKQRGRDTTQVSGTSSSITYGTKQHVERMKHIVFVNGTVYANDTNRSYPLQLNNISFTLSVCRAGQSGRLCGSCLI